MTEVQELLEKGLWLQLSGDGQGAQRLFEQALRLDPLNPRLRELLQEKVASWGASLTPLPVEPDGNEPGTARGQAQAQGNAQGQGPGPDDHETAWDASGATDASLKLGREKGRDALEILGEPVPKRMAPLAPQGAPPDDVGRLLKNARDLLDLDNHSGALGLIQKGLEQRPSHPELLRLRDHSERTLQTMFESKLGDLSARPRVLMREDEVIWLNLDHRAGFVLAQIDGTVSFEELFLVSGMSRLDTARILAQLKDELVIGCG
jgi:hypothetical protein